jgi:propanol-preferring alcohol dehydrogenase
VSFFGVPYEASVQTTYWGNRAELVEVLDLGARGLLRAEVSRFGLEEAAEAYQALAAGSVDGRAVVVPNERYRS